MNTTINVEETIQTINKQNKRIEELCLEIEKLKEDIEAIFASHFSVFKRYEDYKSRNEKAIEYIKIAKTNEENDNIIETYKSIMTVAKKLNVDGTHIVDVCRGRRKTAYGYKWRYIDE